MAKKKRPASMVSHTELSALAQCEMRWHLRYREGIKGDDSAALVLGRLLDRSAAAFWRDGDWASEMRLAVAEEGGGDPDKVDLDRLDSIEGMEVPAKAVWLMTRYGMQYGDEQASGAVASIGQQVDLKAKIGANTYQAIIDEIWDVDGELWMVERKSYSRRDRVAMVDVDPQLTNNLWVARVNGYDCVGIVFDGIYTYRWKREKPTQAQMMEEIQPDHPGLTQKDLRAKAKEVIERHPGIDRPVHESFDRLWLDRTDDHIGAAQAEVKAVVSRRTSLRRGAKPTRNIGPLCNSCGQKPVCWERLGFPQEIEFDGSDL